MIKLRFYEDTDEDAVLELWQRTWEKTRPDIDFRGRRDTTFGQHWRTKIIPSAFIILAEDNGVIVGVVTIDPKTHYLDQFFVAPEYWGSDVAKKLLDEAKQLSFADICLKVNEENYRAIHFYEKHGFVKAVKMSHPEGVGFVYVMQWRS